MQRILIFFRSELTYFQERIVDNSRRLIASNFLKSLSNPLTSIFLNAFVWRSTESLASVALYNVGQFVGLPIAFYVNGLLLRKFPIRQTMLIGAILTGTSAAAIVLSGGAAPALIPIYGLVWGFGNGMYWGNRHSLELNYTPPEWRRYFYSLLASTGSIINILLPLFAGWFIVIAETSGLSSATHAYWMLMGLALLFLIGSGLIIVASTFNVSAPLKILRFRARPIFGSRRILQLSYGMLDGVEFLPVLLVLYAVGSEGILGSITALAALVTAIALYLYGRAKKSRERANLLLSALAYLGSTVALFFLPRQLGIIIYMLGMSSAIAFSNTAGSTILVGLIEKEQAGPEDSYSLIFDSELFLNTGRLIAVGIILGAAYLISEATAFFIAPIFVAALHVFLILSFLRRKHS